jgi:hypothetical protein
LERDETPRRHRTDHRAAEGRTPIGAQSPQRHAGQCINALPSAAAMNFQKLLGFFLCRLFHLVRSLFTPAFRDQFLAVMS